MFFFESLGTSSDSEPSFFFNRTGSRNCGTAQAKYRPRLVPCLYPIKDRARDRLAPGGVPIKGLHCDVTLRGPLACYQPRSTLNQEEVLGKHIKHRVVRIFPHCEGIKRVNGDPSIG